jgi:H+-translocating NAD(P) transhydrogenase subunit alpha
MREHVLEQIEKLNEKAATLTNELGTLSDTLSSMPEGMGHMPFVYSLTIFMLACFVGYYVVWKVTPALHSPLMGVTNAISSVIIVGALLAAGSEINHSGSRVFGFLAVLLASINIFGGFIVTQRMLSMFRKKGESPS